MTSNYSHIIYKLEQFIKRYYLNALIKGILLFLAIGLLYFLFTLIIEHTLWLNPNFRTVLFWLFIIIEVSLLIKFIAIPLSHLFKIRQGISNEYASQLIGTHFPDVNDKLTNLLQLNQHQNKSDLLIASIEQKSSQLKLIPFQKAIDLKANQKYIPLALLPIIIILISFLSGQYNWFTESYTRIINHNVAYEPPAPFQFYVINDTLSIVQNNDFKLLVRVEGEKLPSNPQIIYNNKTYYLTQNTPTEYSFIFNQVKEPIQFNISSNQFKSKDYFLDVIEAPELLAFDMYLNYPSYTSKTKDKITGNGNATIPEGTSVTWRLKTKSSQDQVNIYANDTLSFLSDKPFIYQTGKKVYQNYNYTISLSNKQLKNYEQLNYSLKIIKDQYPKINVESAIDSLDKETLYFKGQATDDYAISKLQLVYYPLQNPKEKRRVNFDINKSNFQNLIYSFPNQLDIEEGIPYELYFEVFDNDLLHYFKSAKSNTFRYRKRTTDEANVRKLNQQKEQIQQLNNAKSAFEKQEERLKDLSKTQKEKSELNFNDKRKFKDFIKRQEQQEQLMKNFNKKLNDNLENFKKDEEDPLKEDLKQRLKDNEDQLKKDQKLLDELKQMQDKINKEEFTQKLEELANKNKSKKRSMEQLLELTKRFYVAKKAEQLAEQLKDLAQKQDDLRKNNKTNTVENQKEINQKFENITMDIKALQNDNKNLKKPFKYSDDGILESETIRVLKQSQSILKDKEELQKNLNQDNDLQNLNKQLSNKQKKAVSKMKSLQQKLSKMIPTSGGGGGSGEMLEEDIDVLRQILDNLLKFSFDQEALMNTLKNIQIDNNKYGSYIIKQNILKTHFQHIDDSLFALSLRQPKLSENVNKLITQVYYHIEKTTKQLSENNTYKGTSSQQYIITNTNKLADILSRLMDNMQNKMMKMGKGEGDMQLPDIIMKQEELAEEMKKQMQKGKKKSPGEQGNQGEQAKKGNKGSQGQEGQNGKKSNSGQSGQDGQDGQSSKKGSQGQQGQQGNRGQQSTNGLTGNNRNTSNNASQSNNSEQKSSTNNATGTSDKQGNKGTSGSNENNTNQSQNNQPGYGEPMSDEESRQLYKIYKQQQQLRQMLEDQIKQNNSPNTANELIKQMEQVEDDLINYGFTNETLEKMMNVKHQLLKLNNASFVQDRDKQRTSSTNLKKFDSNSSIPIEQIKSYFNTTETLNRVTLPLKPQYQNKSKTYFKTIND